MDVEEMADLLRALNELDPRDRRAVLHRVFREPDVRLAAPLVEARKGVDGPPLLLLYAAAGRSVVRQHKGTSESRGSATERWVADLIQATLEALVRLVTRFRPYLDESQWGGVHTALAQLFRDAPGFAEHPRYRPLVDAIRNAARQTLVEAAKPEPNYMGGLEPVKLGLLLADEKLGDVLLDLLRAREVFNEKIASAESRRDLAFLTMTASAITQADSPRQWAEFAAIIVDGLSPNARPPADGETRETLARLGRSLLKKLPASLDERVTAALRAALESVKGQGK
jgi:hypothetical protein